MPGMWHPVAFSHQQATGRTKPFVAECEQRQSDTRIRKPFLIKALGLPEVTDVTLTCELLGHAVADSLGVSHPAGALIEISDSFVEATATNFAPRRLRPGPAVGCEYWASVAPVRRGDGVPADALSEAALVYGLDLAIQNTDRRADNPNCGRREGRYVVYDFDQAFGFLLAIGAQPEPWKFSQHTWRRNHIFYEALRVGQAGLDWAPLVGSLRALDIPAFRELCTMVPDSWKRWADRIVDHLEAIQQHADDLEAELRGSLTT